MSWGEFAGQTWQTVKNFNGIGEKLGLDALEQIVKNHEQRTWGNVDRWVRNRAGKEPVMQKMIDFGVKHGLDGADVGGSEGFTNVAKRMLVNNLGPELNKEYEGLVNDFNKQAIHGYYRAGAVAGVGVAGTLGARGIYKRTFGN